MMYIDFNDARNQVRALADAEPDRTAHCEYINRTTGEPECIVGVMLVNNGVSTSVLLDMDSADLGGTKITDSHMDSEITSMLSPDAISYLGLVQDMQDNGSTWKKSVDYADSIWFNNQYA
jgi:hypothetical protein